MTSLQSQITYSLISRRCANRYSSSWVNKYSVMTLQLHHGHHIYVARVLLSHSHVESLFHIYFKTFLSTVWLPFYCLHHCTDRFVCVFLFIQAGDALIHLYNNFISDFETKISLLKFAHFTVVVSHQFLDKNAGINYLEGVISKLRDTRESRVEEPILYVKMQIATFLLEEGNQKDCQNLLEEGKTTLDSMVDVDPSVHGTYYWVCSQYHKARQEYSEFYKSCLLYLAYTTVESLSEPFKQVLHITPCLYFDTNILSLLLQFLIGFICVSEPGI
jgi:hypothetical protein